MPPDRSEHPAAHACRLYNDRLTRSGSHLRWVTTSSGEMRLVSIDRPRGARMADPVPEGDALKTSGSEG